MRNLHEKQELPHGKLFPLRESSQRRRSKYLAKNGGVSHNAVLPSIAVNPREYTVQRYHTGDNTAHPAGTIFRADFLQTMP